MRTGSGIIIIFAAVTATRCGDDGKDGPSHAQTKAVSHEVVTQMPDAALVDDLLKNAPALDETAFLRLLGDKAGAALRNDYNIVAPTVSSFSLVTFDYDACFVDKANTFAVAGQSFTFDLSVDRSACREKSASEFETSVDEVEALASHAALLIEMTCQGTSFPQLIPFAGKKATDVVDIPEFKAAYQVDNAKTCDPSGGVRSKTIHYTDVRVNGSLLKVRSLQHEVDALWGENEKAPCLWTKTPGSANVVRGKCTHLDFWHEELVGLVVGKDENTVVYELVEVATEDMAGSIFATNFTAGRARIRVNNWTGTLEFKSDAAQPDVYATGEFSDGAARVKVSYGKVGFAKIGP